MQSIERWMPVVGYEGYYEVSDHGRVRSVDRIVVTKTGVTRHYKAKMMSVRAMRTGHPQTMLFRDGTKITHMVYRLMLTAFVGPPPEGYDACHNDGDATNNHLSNLRWDTRAENIRDEVRHGTHAQSRKTHCNHGHLLVAPNLTAYGLRRGARNCRACHQAHAYAQRHYEPFSHAVSDQKFAQIMREAVPS